MFLQTINFVRIKVLTHSSRQWITTETCKTKAIQANLGIIMHIPTYSGIMRETQELIRYIQIYSEPCVTMVYSEPSHIQYQRHIRNHARDNN